MEKNKSFIFTCIISLVVFWGVLYYSAIYAYAGSNAGEEVYFTHTHSNNCYCAVTESCDSSHTSRHGQQYSDYHCSTCGTTTRHNVEADNCYCPAQGSSWQENGFTQCTICGTIHSVWGSSPGIHTFSVNKLVCSIPEGDRTAGIRITADNNWTNQGVVLHVETNILNQDETISGISYSWGSSEKVAEDNGTYTVDATNSAGQTVTASIAVNCIDKVTPVINSISGDTGSMTQDSITVTVDASDGESGLADQAFSFDGGGTFTSSSQFTVKEGIDVNCVVKDRAGNTSCKSVKRSDFPYPPPPPPPAKEVPSTPVATTPSSTNGTHTPSTQGNTGGKDEKSSTKPIQKDDSSTNKKTDPKADNQSESTQTKDGNKKDIVKKTDQLTDEEDAMNDTISDNKGKLSGRNIGSVKPYGPDERNEVNMETTNKISIYRLKGESGSPDKSSSSDYDETIPDEQLIQEPDTARSTWSGSMEKFFNWYGAKTAGIILITISVLGLIRKLWIQTVFLYCYNGGEEYKKLGILHLKKNKKEFTLFLPNTLLDEADTPRYRLLVHRKLVKKYDKMDLVLQSEEQKLRQSLEECVDFVL